MHQLKFALGKEDKEEKSISRTGYSMKNFNQSKSQSMWALDPDVTGGGDLQNQHELKLNKLKQNLESSLKNSFNKEKVFTQIIFYEIVESMQVFLGEDMSEIDCLHEIEKKMKQIIDESKEQNKNFNVSFYELLVKRMKKLKKKEKKQELNEYDRIINTNFKKKSAVQYINEDINNRQEYLEMKQNKISKGTKISGKISSNDGSSSKKSNSSNEGKLKGLLSQDKFSLTKGQDKERDDSILQANESVSFSAVISQSMAVRQRSPRVVLNTKKTKPKQQLIKQEKQDDKDQGKDEAFIFFRPKKTKKVGY